MSSNGRISTSEDGDEDASDEESSTINGTSPRDSRSVSGSSTRGGSRTSLPIPGANKIPIRGAGSSSTSVAQSLQSNHSHRRSDSRGPGPSSSPPNTARDKFLGYFFGQNGPGPLSADNGIQPHRSASQPEMQVTPASQPSSVGRDVLGPDPVLGSGLMAGKRDGANPAFDMKSLGKHIEAVRRPQALVFPASLTAVI